MRYKILKDGEVINTIVADENFCKTYCETNGYTYKADPLPEPEPEPEPPTTEERLEKLESENKLLREQVSAQADQAEFYEDCIAEMAAVVYA